MSAFEERVPNLPPVSPEVMSSIKTLGGIVACMADSASPAAAAVQTPAAVPAAPPAPAVDMAQITRVMLDVVSRLTGYPVDMVGLDMDIEADLGIDSIKRVEIMSEFETVMPNLPAVNPEAMAGLKTLQQICDHIATSGTAPASAEPAAKPPITKAEPVLEEETADVPITVKRQVVKIHKASLGKGQPVTIPPGKILYVTDDKTGLAAAIVEEMTSRKLKARLIAIDDDTPEAAGLVIIPGALKKKGGALAVLPGFKKKDNDIWDRTHDEFLKSAFIMAGKTGHGLNEAASLGGAFFVTLTVQDGAFGFNNGKLESPILGGLSGLSKTAALEWPTVNCKAIDLAPSMKPNKSLAARIVDECLHAGPGEVGFSGDDRFILTLTPEEIAMGSLDLKQKDVVVVSGGAKGVTAAAAIALAVTVKPMIVLLGRSPNPVRNRPGWPR
jgi:acyl carrier protein